MERKDLPIIDFFAYTFKGFNIRFDNKRDSADFIYRHLSYILPSDVYVFMAANNMLEYEIAENSGMGYRFRMFFPNIGVNIMSDGVTEGHGLHVILSGTILGMSEMDRDKFKSFNDHILENIKMLSLFYNDTYGLGCVDPSNEGFDNSKPIKPEDISFLVSRIDIAYDFNVNFEEFFNRINDGLYWSSSRKDPSMIIDPYKHGTIYLGRRSAPFFIRIYDKYKELHDRNKSLLGLVKDDLPEDYTRVEFEIKNHQRCQYALEAFNLYLESPEFIGNLCYSKLKFYDIPDPEKPDDKVLWDVYERVILYNCTDFMVEYDKTYQATINLTYLQFQANLITTYCRRMPGLLKLLCNNLAPSKSALRKTANLSVDFDTLYENARVIEEEQELIILEHLTFFHNDLTGVELDPNKKDYDGLYDYYFSNRLISDQEDSYV